MAVNPYRVRQAQEFLLGVARARQQGLPGLVTYTVFCERFGLGPAHNNGIMRALLLAIGSDCAANDWPDLAALVVRSDTEGPGQGWYDAHSLQFGDLAAWRRHRDDCWARANEVLLP